MNLPAWIANIVAFPMLPLTSKVAPRLRRIGSGESRYASPLGLKAQMHFDEALSCRRHGEWADFAKESLKATPCFIGERLVSVVATTYAYTAGDAPFVPYTWFIESLYVPEDFGRELVALMDNRRAHPHYLQNLDAFKSGVELFDWHTIGWVGEEDTIKEIARYLAVLFAQSKGWDLVALVKRIRKQEKEKAPQNLQRSFKKRPDGLKDHLRRELPSLNQNYVLIRASLSHAEYLKAEVNILVGDDELTAFAQSRRAALPGN